MEQRYFIELAYNGTAYNGWQIQPNALGIQQVIEEALAILIKEKMPVTGAGRTDTGVHANYFVAHFTTSSTSICTDELVRKLNHMLPEDISILRIFPVRITDHSRFSALSRTYKYYVSTRKNPFRQDTSLLVYSIPDIIRMNEAAADLLNYSDFGSFCRTGTNVRNHICRITEATWEINGDMLVFTIKANRFLRNMVRAIVGTLLKVGYEKISVEEFREIIEAKNRCRASTSAIARGLFLADIEYPPEVISNRKPVQP